MPVHKAIHIHQNQMKKKNIKKTQYVTKVFLKGVFL